MIEAKDLKPGQFVAKEPFLVSEAQLRKDRNGNDYYTLTLNYYKGESLPAKVWSQNITEPIQPGSFIEVYAQVESFMDRLQLSVQRYDVIDDEGLNPADFARATDIDTEAAFDELFNWSEQDCANPYLLALMKAFAENASFAQRFRQAPAATFHHHNYVGGLVEHTLQLRHLVMKLIELYEELVDRELLLAAVSLHDVGKIYGYEIKNAVPQRTDVGKLLEHLFIGASMVSNQWDALARAEEWPPEANELKHRLLHIILSHHGRLDWGSPIVPQTLEAILLHLGDHLNANMKAAIDGIARMQSGDTWSPDVHILDYKRSLYSPGQTVPGEETDA